MSSTGASPSMDLKRPQPQRISLPYPLSTASSEASPRRSGSSSPGLSESNLSQPSSRSPCMSSKHFRAQARAMREATANAWSKDKPFTARVIGWRRMTAEDAPRQVAPHPVDDTGPPCRPARRLRGREAEARVQERLQERLLAVGQRLQWPRWRFQNSWRVMGGGRTEVLEAELTVITGWGGRGGGTGGRGCVCVAFASPRALFPFLCRHVIPGCHCIPCGPYQPYFISGPRVAGAVGVLGSSAKKTGAHDEDPFSLTSALHARCTRACAHICPP